MTHEDPGWSQAFRGLNLFLIPVAGPLMRKRGERQKNGLIVIRSVFVGVVVAMFVYVFLLTFIVPFDGGDESWVPLAIALIGVASLAGIGIFRRRPLPTMSPQALAGAYRAAFFIEVGLAEAAALFGFVGVFLTESLWIYLLGLSFALVGLSLLAPTRGDIERRQREITAAGSPLSLLDALIEVHPGQPGGTPST